MSFLALGFWKVAQVLGKPYASARGLTSGREFGQTVDTS